MIPPLVYVCLGVFRYVFYVCLFVCMFVCVFVCVFVVYVCLSVCLFVRLLNGMGDPGSHCPYQTLKTLFIDELERNTE